MEINHPFVLLTKGRDFKPLIFFANDGIPAIHYLPFIIRWNNRVVSPIINGLFTRITMWQNERTHPKNRFFKKNKAEIEIEIFSISSLFSRQHQFAIPIDKPHKIEFYHIIYINKGAGTHY